MSLSIIILHPRAFPGGFPAPHDSLRGPREGRRVLCRVKFSPQPGRAGRCPPSPLPSARVAGARWGWANPKADLLESFAEILLFMLNLERRIEALGSIKAEVSHHKQVFSTSRKEGKKNIPWSVQASAFASNYPRTNIDASCKRQRFPWLCSQPSLEQRHITPGWQQGRRKK